MPGGIKRLHRGAIKQLLPRVQVVIDQHEGPIKHLYG